MIKFLTINIVVRTRDNVKVNPYLKKGFPLESRTFQDEFSKKAQKLHTGVQFYG